MRILFFGTYDVTAHPRVAVLIEGLGAHFEDVEERNVPLDFATADRISVVSSPRNLPAFAVRVISAWRRLLKAASGTPAPGVVMVGHLGQFDVLLARVRFRRATIVLDYLISGASTSADRDIGSPLVRRVLAALDRLALSAADIVIVDTYERLEELPAAKRPDAVVVPVGATQTWFREPKPGDASRLSVIFFGLFTPLQGTVTIGRALADLADDPIDVTMIGTGQEYDASRAAAESNPNIDWIEWLSGAELPDIVARHDVCLGIVGSTPKGRRVVPTKAFQGAAAGCLVVTSDTKPQRRAFGETARYVAPGDHADLSAMLRAIAVDSALLEARRRSYRHAVDRFTPQKVVEPLVEALKRRSR